MLVAAAAAAVPLLAVLAISQVSAAQVEPII